MPSEPTANGTKGSESRERPDWYVPIVPTEDDARTVQDLLRGLQVVTDPDDIPDDLRADLKAYLDQFGTPRNLA
jgi:hypothetical protein